MRGRGRGGKVLLQCIFKYVMQNRIALTGQTERVGQVFTQEVRLVPHQAEKGVEFGFLTSWVRA